MAYISDEDIKGFQTTLEGIKKTIESLDSKTQDPPIEPDTFESLAASENFLEGLTRNSKTFTTDGSGKPTFESLIEQANL